jgi:nucleoside 2-deoxyribosyltransferase
MKDIYLTSTFTNPWNVAFNPLIGEALEVAGFSCYLPHRDTDQKGGPAVVFAGDMAGMAHARCIVAVAKNESPNWGAEVGWFHASGKPIIALAETDHAIPLICNGMVTEVVRAENLDDITSYADRLKAVIRSHLG